MKINKEGLDLIKRFEGCKLKAYRDIVGVLTIGYGHTGGDVYPGLVISQAKAEELLLEDLQYFEEAVLNLLTVNVTSNQLSALVSFTYNLGEGNLSKSTLLRSINNNDFIKASNEFAKWPNAGGKKVEGLVRRREAERALFLKV